MILSIFLACSVVLSAGLGQATRVEDIKVQTYEKRMLEQPGGGETVQAPELQRLQEVPVAYDRPLTTSQPTSPNVVTEQLPDPSQADAWFRSRLAQFSESIQRDYQAIFFGSDDDPRTPQPGAAKLIQEIERPKRMQLTLEEAVRRALANNYQIRIEGYGPAINTAQIVQAEAAFDMAFFTNLNRTNLDRPRPQPFAFQESQTTIWQTGVRKLLATGATATLTYDFNRTYTYLPAQARPTAINPSYTQGLTAELRQPFLRGFGIDFNRAQINIAKNQRSASSERFRRTVITTLNDTERAYWNLVQARRDVVITAELVAQAARTLSQVRSRIDYDAYQTLEANAEAQVAARYAEFIRVKNTVRDAEDILLNLMNDPQYALSGDWEVVPSEIPTIVPVVRDKFHEVEQALQHRPEIKEAQFAVEVARLQLGVAKNQALPRLDVVFRMTAQGLGRNADRAFDQMSGADWVDNFIGLEYLWNFGERAERAGIRAAQMQHSQAIFAYKKAIDDVITDCRTALRQLQTTFDQIRPNVVAVLSSEDNLRSIQEREERKSPEQLNTVLSAQVQLAQNRRALLQAIVTYNQFIKDVERAKGTLLQFDNVTLSEVP